MASGARQRFWLIYAENSRKTPLYMAGSLSIQR